MNDKYIIRNCPICEHCDWDNGYGELEEGYICKRITIDSFECKDIENCLLKQIVELCKNNQYPIYNQKLEMIGYEKSPLSKEILQLIDIQEV